MVRMAADWLAGHPRCPAQACLEESAYPSFWAPVGTIPGVGIWPSWAALVWLWYGTGEPAPTLRSPVLDLGRLAR